MREEQTPLPDGVPPPDLIGRLASEAYRAAPAGEPGDSLKAAFDGLADRCPGPSLLRDLMRASGSSNGAATSEKRAISTLPATSPQWETRAYYFLAGSALETVTQTRETGGGALPGVRGDFPALHQTVNGKPLVWLDNAATTHKPQAVIDTVARFYAHDNSNVHRGAHALAKRATDAYEGTRKTVAAFIGGPSPEQIVWVRGATEAINLVAQSFGRRFVGPGDEVMITTLEHHSNIVPWQMLCEATGAALRIVPISDDGELLLGEYARMLSSRTKIVAVTQVS
ncbi:MAG: cysteine desulfurase / selenocysteine lyase, partial [Actinomycetota bacterium]|nr:cysteine desulfurase / selenocysteine lyase [Actinomycetota bacterium]